MIKGICQECHKAGSIHVHHKDGNHENDVTRNREVLCPSCHRKAHIEILLATTGRPSTHPLPERLPIDWQPEPIPWAEVRRQYFAYFPRA